MSRVLVFCILSFLSFLLTSCSPDDNLSSSDAEVPDTVSENFSQVTVSPEGRLEISAARVETYADSDRTVFELAGMRELNNSGELTMEGGADIIEVSGNQDGRAEGNIRISDIEEDTRLEAEHLEWDETDRKLSSRESVTIKSGDGLTVSGKGFFVDMAREQYTFTDGVEGTLELKDEN